jgi:hypothetical protein
MTDRFPTFEMVLKKRGRKWTWCVRKSEGMAIMQGSEADRAAAKYQAYRALFLLLLTVPYQLRRPSGLDINDAGISGHWRAQVGDIVRAGGGSDLA